MTPSVFPYARREGSSEGYPGSLSPHRSANENHWSCKKWFMLIFSRRNGFWLWVYNDPKNRKFSFYQFEKASLMNLTVTAFSSRYTTVFPDTAIPI